MKPREKPNVSENSDRGGKIPDENKWVWDLYEEIRLKAEKASKPLENYLEIFEVHKKVLTMSPEEYVKGKKIK